MSTKRPKGRPKKQKSYKELRKIWYKKLADEGFNDIEWGSPDSGYLTWTPKPNSADEMRERQTYYRMCERYLQNYQYLRGKDRFIWKLHCKGCTYKEITDTYNKHYKIKVSIWKIHQAVQKILERARAWNETNEAGIFVD